MRINNNGNVGIGTTNPTNKLHIVDGNIYAIQTTSTQNISQTLAAYNNPNPNIGVRQAQINLSGQYSSGVDEAQARIADIPTANADATLTFHTTDSTTGSGVLTERMRIAANGNVGIGTASPGGKLTVVTLPSSAADLEPMVYDTATGIIYYSTSSLRYKTNIQNLTDNFSSILKLTPRSFTCKNTGKHDIGLIAEEVDALGLKNLVIYDKDGQPESLKYDRIPLYLLEVLKTRQNNIEDLKKQRERDLIESKSLENSIKAENTVLKAKNMQLEARIKAIEKKLNISKL
jgi:hypothetical protein